MITIYKYPLKLLNRQIVEMPQKARPLSVHEQHDQLMLWAQVDTDLPPQARCIVIVGTGTPILKVPDIFIGTVVTNHGTLVLHVFEDQREPEGRRPAWP